MKSPVQLVIFFITIIITAGYLAMSDSLNTTQSQQISLEDYQRAESFLSVNTSKLVKNNYLSIHWLEKAGEFWFREELPSGHRFKSGNAEKGMLSDAFNHERLSAVLQERFPDKSITPENLPFDHIKFSKTGLLKFKIDDQEFECPIDTYECLNNKDEAETVSDTGNHSPDKQWSIIRSGNDLVLKVNGPSEKIIPLTEDGINGFAYGAPMLSPSRAFQVSTPVENLAADGYWSPDSRYFITYQLDLRKTGTLALTQSTPVKGLRPKTVQYKYPQAGDAHIPEGHLIIIDAQEQTVVHAAQEPLLQVYYGDPIWGGFEGNDFFFVEFIRGYKTLRLNKLSPEYGKVTTVIEESHELYVDNWIQDYWVLPDSQEILWTSERDGWNHLYLYDLNTGALKNQITSGDFLVRTVRSIDHEKRRVYFEAGGKESGDPYYRYLYRVDFDGSDLMLLTPEKATHATKLSPDFKYFSDTYSTIDKPGVHVVRSAETGKLILELGIGDASALYQQGWQPPKPFTVKAADGETDVYGHLYLPSDFDPDKKYPLINDVYTGPHNFFTTKGFYTHYSQAPALAELGFIVMKMDGRGTGKRQRSFHEYSYKNLAGGTDDHVTAIKQLAEQYSYIDSDRVGIFGFSAGGYDTAQAMFKYPDMFKVGVAASGNHDFRTDKVGWNEHWMGYPVDQNYVNQSNLTNAGNLRGKLLLAHGELDENVNPAATLQLAKALMDANRDFDLMIYPNEGHVLDNNPYFVRKRWDYFVQFLAGKQPPDQYRISSME